VDPVHPVRAKSFCPSRQRSACDRTLHLSVMNPLPMRTDMLFHNFAIGIILSAAPSVVHAQDIIIVPCNGDTLVGTYCYVNNDQQAWHWQSACGEPVFMQFISGTIESSNFDQLRLYAGPDNFAPLLFANPATPVELDLTGINVI